jgi:hypothetical protein
MENTPTQLRARLEDVNCRMKGHDAAIAAANEHRDIERKNLKECREEKKQILAEMKAQREMLTVSKPRKGA